VPFVHDHGPFVVHAPSGKLGEYPRTVIVHRLGKLRILRDRALVESAAPHVERALSVWIRALLLGYHQRSAAAGALAIKRDVPIADDVVFGVVRGHRRHQDTILYVYVTDPDRLPDMAVR